MRLFLPVPPRTPCYLGQLGCGVLLPFPACNPFLPHPAPLRWIYFDFCLVGAGFVILVWFRKRDTGSERESVIENKGRLPHEQNCYPRAMTTRFSKYLHFWMRSLSIPGKAKVFQRWNLFSFRRPDTSHLPIVFFKKQFLWLRLEWSFCLDFGSWLSLDVQQSFLL